MSRRTRGARPRGVPGAGLVAAAAVVLGGCASGNGASSPTTGPAAVRVIAASVSRTVAAGRVATTVQLTSEATTTSGPTAETITGTGAFDFAQQRGAIDLALPANTGSLDELVVGSTAYVEVPAPLRATLAGGSWVTAPVTALDGQGTGTSALLAALASPDPIPVLDLFRLPIELAVPEGHPVLGGVATSEYRAVVELSPASVRRSPLGGTSLTQVGRLAALLGSGVLPVDVWIDGSGRLRLLDLLAQGAGSQIHVTRGFADFGAPVSVALPPGSEIVPGSSLVQSGALAALLLGTAAPTAPAPPSPGAVATR